MKRALLLGVTCVIILGTASAGSAQTLPDAKFALHARTKTIKATEICNLNDPNSQGIPCSDYVTAWPVGVSADVYLVVGEADPAFGLQGLRCGIDYDAAFGSGADLFDWVLCTDGLEFPAVGPNGEWPAAGAGNTITWLTCQNTVISPNYVHGVAGAFYIYAYDPDTFRITPHNQTIAGPTLEVADCNAASTFLPLDSVLGEVDFGGGAGVTPCEEVHARFDFQPGSCPNQLVDLNGGFAVAAIVGQVGYPVSDINQATIQVEGVSPSKIMVKDVATPFAGTSCSCHAAGGDGIDDLQLRISQPDLIAAIGRVSGGDQVVLTATWELNDATPFSASDCAVITVRGRGPMAAGADLASSGGPTRISFSLSEDGPVRLSVFDVSGRKVADLVNGFRPGGTHVVDWDAAGQASGIYFYRLVTGTQVKTQKLILVR